MSFLAFHTPRNKNAALHERRFYKPLAVLHCRRKRHSRDIYQLHPARVQVGLGEHSDTYRLKVEETWPISHADGSLRQGITTTEARYKAGRYMGQNRSCLHRHRRFEKQRSVLDTGEKGSQALTSIDRGHLLG